MCRPEIALYQGYHLKVQCVGFKKLYRQGFKIIRIITSLCVLNKLKVRINIVFVIFISQYISTYTLLANCDPCGHLKLTSTLVEVH